MDLSGFYQTTAALVPLFLLTIVSALRDARWLRRYRHAAVLYVLVGGPAVFAESCSLLALAGFEAEPFSRSVALGGCMWLLMLTLAIIFGLVVPPELARPDPQPHSQPHKPDRTAPDRSAQPEPPGVRNRTNSDETEPETTGGRHS